MSAAEIVAQIKALAEPEKERLFCLLVQNKELREDLLDSIIVEKRKDEPSRPWADMLKDYLISF